jgi:hypothetical protein
VAVVSLLAAGMAGCRSVRSDEALAMLDVSVAADVPAFTTARFSVAGRPEIWPHEVRFDGRTTLKFGYYLPGPNGTLRITGQALSASCLVGAGSAEVDVQLGRASSVVTLVIKALVEPDPTCATTHDAGQDGVGDAVSADAVDVAPPADATPDAVDVPSTADAADAGADAAPDVIAKDATVDVPPTPPVCMAATKVCPGASECCSGLVCGTTSLGRVCCGNFNVTCTRTGGEDCCGQLECVSGHCCLPATYACSGSSCCPGLVCGNTSLGRVCCGNAGAPCKRADGADCCGSLECVNNVCR